MDSLLHSVPQLAAYAPAILWLVALCLIVLVQGFLAGALGLGGGEETAGMPLKGDHSKRSFRILRTYANSAENFGVMAAATALAIVAGANVTMVNWLVGLHVVFRLIYWVIYYAGIGKVAGGPRTISYVGGWLMNLVLALAAAYAMLM
jgi:uncharacterized MAPEG superfamily protein